MTDFAVLAPTSDVEPSRIALRDSHLQLNYKNMRGTQLARFNDWKKRVDEYAFDRTYHFPRIREIYARALINESQREALHVTRKVLEAVAKNSFLGSQGWVAQYSDVIASMRETISDRETSDPETIGEQSLYTCTQLLRSCAYNISEGPSFIRSPLAIPALEEKYYLTDLLTY